MSKVLLGSALLGMAVLTSGLAAGPALARPSARSAPDGGPFPVTCTSPLHPRLAARLARGLRTALRGRLSTVALRVDDRSDQLG